MASSRKRTTLPGSRKQALPDAQVVGELDPEQPMEITVVLRPRAGPAAPEAAAFALGNKPPAERQYLSRAEAAAQFGADPADLAKLEVFAQAHHLTVSQVSLLTRTVHLVGTIGNLVAAFR